MKIRSLLLAVGLGFGLAVVLLALLVSPSPVARADTGIYYVREGGSGDCLAATTPCSNVQRAINLAIAPGDEVWVATGIYTESLIITHSVNLRGGWNVSFTAQSPITYPTVVDGNGAHVVQVDAASAEIELYGFTLTNGKDGLNIDAGAVTVTQVTLSGISRQAVDVDGGTVLVQQSVITDIQREGVQVENGSVVVRDCVLANVGYDAGETRAGISVKGGNVRIEHTSLTSATNEGVHILGGVVILDDVTIAGTGHEGVQVEGGAATVLNCTIHDTFQEGIKISGTHTVNGNLVYDTGEHGIYVHDGAATVINNTVRDTISDAIRIATGSVVTVDGNIIYNAGDDCIEANGDRVLIANNRIEGCNDHGIKAQGVNHAYINANRVYSANQAHVAGTAGIDLDNAGAFTVTNNIVADANGVSVLVENSAGPHNFIYHNTLVGSATGQQGVGISVTVPGVTITLANNIIVSHTVGITKTVGATLVVSRTLLWGNGSDPISGTGVITSAPLFVAPASQDYHIQENSPAVDAGVEVGVSGDVDGDPRISPPDVGADEVVQKIYLPLVMRAYLPPSYLQNSGFEGLVCAPDSPGGWCDGNWSNDANHDGGVYDNIFTPQGWVTWWREGEPYAHPEVKVIPNLPPFNGSPDRIRSGNYATLLFSFYRLQDMGFYQVVTGLSPGSVVQFSAYAHGWSCDSDDHLGYSCGDPWNQTFQVSIEPNGAADPFSLSVVWSVAKLSPDYYSLIGPVTAQVGAGGSVCVYVRSQTKFPFKYGDAYWDDASLTVQSP